MTALPVTLLVVAKAPEPGRAKTRLAATVGDRVAAEIAAAALLDTLDAVAATPVTARVVALTGDLDAAASAAEIRCRLAVVHGDRSARRRLRRPARQCARRRRQPAGHPVLQIGMDTPQVTAELLAGCARGCCRPRPCWGRRATAVGGYSGCRTPAAAACLRGVPMSQSDTGALTVKALRDNGIDVTPAELLADSTLSTMSLWYALLVIRPAASLGSPMRSGFE